MFVEMRVRAAELEPIERRLDADANAHQISAKARFRVIAVDIPVAVARMEELRVPVHIVAFERGAACVCEGDDIAKIGEETRAHSVFAVLLEIDLQGAGDLPSRPSRKLDVETTDDARPKFDDAFVDGNVLRRKIDPRVRLREIAQVVQDARFVTEWIGIAIRDQRRDVIDRASFDRSKRGGDDFIGR